MLPILFADVLQYVFGILMFVAALFLILLVLVQRGRGGGLAGALGGMGGQSAFGAKAGDTFTKVTVIAASFWIVLCLASVWVLGRQSNKLGPTGGPLSIPSSTGVPAGGTTAPPIDSSESGLPIGTGEDRGSTPGETATPDATGPAGVDAGSASDTGPATSVPPQTSQP